MIKANRTNDTKLFDSHTTCTSITKVENATKTKANFASNAQIHEKLQAYFYVLDSSSATFVVHFKFENLICY